MNSSESELIQVQDDKFLRNWRKVGSADLYPRYERIREAFEADFTLFADFVSREELGLLRPTQCEVTYVNHIRAGTTWGHGATERVLSMWCPQPTSFLPQPEDVRIGVRYPIRDENGSFLGRLNIDLQPGFLNKDQSPIFILTLTARGRPDGEGFAGVLRFMDRGREWIVRGFAEVTARDLQADVWRRIQ